MSKYVGPNKTTLESYFKKMWSRWTIHWSHVDEKLIRVRVMRFQNYPDLFGRGHRVIFRAKEISAY